MRKINKKYENPIDNILIDIADHCCPCYNAANLTPNDLTTISLLLAITSAFLFNNGCGILAGIFWFVAYYFDCADGYYARKYKLTSDFGDMYDHISDLVKVAVILWLFYCNDNSESKGKFWKIVGVLGILMILLCVHMGCQERIYNNVEHGGFLGMARGLCVGMPEDSILTTRYFGCGTFMTVVSLIIVFYWRIS